MIPVSLVVVLIYSQFRPSGKRNINQKFDLITTTELWGQL